MFQSGTQLIIKLAERVLCQVEAAELGFLRRVRSVTLHDKVLCSCEICETLNIDPLLRIERSQTCWLGRVSRMFQERLLRLFLLVTPTGRRIRDGPRVR